MKGKCKFLNQSTNRVSNTKTPRYQHNTTLVPQRSGQRQIPNSYSKQGTIQNWIKRHLPLLCYQQMQIWKRILGPSICELYLVWNKLMKRLLIYFTCQNILMVLDSALGLSREKKSLHDFSTIKTSLNRFLSILSVPNQYFIFLRTTEQQWFVCDR